MGRTKVLRELQVEAWLTRDKINRYRGVLKLHAREKKLQQSQATKLKSAVSRKLGSLAVDVKRDREIANDLSEGGKRRVLGPLSDYREFYLALNRLEPTEICAAVYQDCDLKRRLLDKLYYKKKEKLKKAIKLELERSALSVEFEEQSDGLPNCEQQRLVVRLQQSITKYNTAKVIRSTYCSMLNILKKDAIFFDTLLNILKENQSSQCKTMLRVTVMGQLAAENLDDVRQKYKRMTRVVLRNMRIREQMLSTVRCQVDDLWAYAQSLVRVESDSAFAKKDTVETSADKILENQLIHLQDICNRVKDTFLVHQYHDVLSRLEDQANQKTTLLARLSANIKNHDLLFNKKNQAVQILETLKHSTKPIEQYKINGHEILEQIELEKKREKELKELKKARGELLTNIRAALHNISTMLFFVKPVAVKAVKKIAKDVNKQTLKEMIAIDDKKDMEETLLELEEGEANVLLLLSKITRKIGILFAMSNFDLNEQEEKAQDLYQTYVSHYNSNLIFGTGEEEPIGLLVEHELVDVTIPTRADIKLHSRQIVEARLKPE
ncbi:hypothetical protein X777_16958 [Ooceraea biroi]|nr:hypothetical protein X777_16958 [Ooceraea biroi]